ELSHRSNTYEEVHNGAIARLKQLYKVPDSYEVIFVQGGASLQFAMLPMNFLAKGKQAGYIMTGSWSEKAFEETHLFGEAYIVGSSKADQYRHLPTITANNIQPDTAYVHM